MRVVAVAGEPAAGKTSIVRAALARLDRPLPPVSAIGLVRLHFYGPDLVVVGDYSPAAGLFAGTDRLSMAVEPQARGLLAHMRGREWAAATVLIEGDRLTGLGFLEAVRALAALRVVVVTAPPEVLAERHRRRGDSQTATFLRGRRTKVERIRAALPVEVMENGSGDDLDRNAARLVELLTRPWVEVSPAPVPASLVPLPAS